MATMAWEIVWLKPLLADLGLNRLKPVNLFCGNEAVFHISAYFMK